MLLLHFALMTDEWVINLSHVSKTYRGRVHALRGIETKVRRGEVFGLLGPNGAGKSTLVKILMTVIKPTKAVGTMLGRPVGHKPTLAHVGYLPEHHRFPDYLTGEQVIHFYGGLAGVPRRVRKQRAGELLEMVGMSNWAGHRVRSYSKGMRQRVGIAQAMVNDPEILLLDEPTDGVDPVGRREIRQLVTRLRDRGKTVFVNSHLLSELEMVCDRVSILVQGMVASQGTIEELTRDKRYYEIELQAESESPESRAGLVDVFRSSLPHGASETLVQKSTGVNGQSLRGSLATGEFIEIENATMRIGTDDANSVQGVLDALRRRGAVIRAVRPVRPSLEDLFMLAVTDPTTGAVFAPGAAQETRKGNAAARHDRHERKGEPVP